jgi:hypothetical protein
MPETHGVVFVGCILQGVAYIETANLDGETNLKQRIVVPYVPIHEQNSEIWGQEFMCFLFSDVFVVVSDAMFHIESACCECVIGQHC